MSEQIDIAGDLGVLSPPLLEMLNLGQLVDVAPPPPPQIIEGACFPGCKMILGSTSKATGVGASSTWRRAWRAANCSGWFGWKLENQ